MLRRSLASPSSHGVASASCRNAFLTSAAKLGSVALLLLVNQVCYSAASRSELLAPRRPRRRRAPIEGLQAHLLCGPATDPGPRAPLSIYTVAPELGHGSDETAKWIYATVAGSAADAKNPDSTEVLPGQKPPESGRPDSNRRRPAWEAGILPLNYARKMRLLREVNVPSPPAGVKRGAPALERA
jgi:hypothetical protein